MEHQNSVDNATAFLVVHTWVEDTNQQTASRERNRGDENDVICADRRLELIKSSIISQLSFRADRTTTTTTGGHDVVEAHDKNHSIQPRLENGTTDQPTLSHTPRAFEQCICCSNNFATAELTQRPCPHRYCKACLQDLFQRSLARKNLFPPRCCRRVLVSLDDEDELKTLLGPDLADRIAAKKIEMSTPAPERTYCHRPDCGLFILPAQHMITDSGAVGWCSLCRARTCAACKSAAPHGGGGGSGSGSCPKDEADEAVLELANRMGWKRCFSCYAVVELVEGCNHMSKYLTIIFLNPV